MRAKEKYELFRRDYGEKLLPQGFTYCRKENLFLRAHADVALAVCIGINPSGSICSLHYDAMPYCNGIRRPIAPARSFCIPWIEPPSGLQSYSEELAQTFLLYYAANKKAFFAEVFDRLTRVTNSREALDFHEWQIAFYNTGRVPPMLECVAVGAYGRALECARFGLHNALDIYQREKRFCYFYKLEDEPPAGKRAREKWEQRRRLNEGTEKRMEFFAAEVRARQQDVDDLEQGNYERLHARIAENEGVSRATLAALGLG